MSLSSRLRPCASHRPFGFFANLLLLFGHALRQRKQLLVSWIRIVLRACFALKHACGPCARRARRHPIDGRWGCLALGRLGVAVAQVQPRISTNSLSPPACPIYGARPTLLFWPSLPQHFAETEETTAARSPLRSHRPSTRANYRRKGLGWRPAFPLAHIQTCVVQTLHETVPTKHVRCL